MAHFFRAYFFLVFPVLILVSVLICTSGVEIGLAGYIAATLIVNILPSALVVLFSNKVSSFAGKLYTGGNTQTPSEKYSGLLDQARYLKSKNQYAKALETVDEFIESVPGHPEALFIKGQILWEGNKDHQSAKQCLVDIIKSTNSENQWHRWAKTFLRDIIKSSDKAEWRQNG
jgi:tetratricopeptide (TPR) repeat protein